MWDASTTKFVFSEVAELKTSALKQILIFFPHNIIDNPAQSL